MENVCSKRCGYLCLFCSYYNFTLLMPFLCLIHNKQKCNSTLIPRYLTVSAKFCIGWRVFITMNTPTCSFWVNPTTTSCCHQMLQMCLNQQLEIALYPLARVTFSKIYSSTVTTTVVFGNCSAPFYNVTIHL